MDHPNEAINQVDSANNRSRSSSISGSRASASVYRSAQESTHTSPHSLLRPITPADDIFTEAPFRYAYDNAYDGYDPGATHLMVAGAQTQYAQYVPPENTKIPEENERALKETLKEHDKEKVYHLTGDIDSLLILATLFSAIIAAFTIESYKKLQPDPSLASAIMLAQLVLHFNGTAGLENTGFVFTSVSNGPTRLDIIINSFWFLSLVASVITASAGIFLKRWLANYLHITCSAPEEWVRVRQVRYASLRRWKVFDLAILLPLLLQLALVLFLIGLALFLLPINTTVAWVVGAGVILYIATLTCMLVIPMVSASCPYQISPFSRAAEYIRGFIIRLRYHKFWRQSLGYGNPYYRFPGDERGIRRESHLDTDVVIGADADLMDNAILERTLRPCVSSFSLSNTLTFVRNILAHRLDRKITSLKHITQEDYMSVPRQVWKVILDVSNEATENLCYYKSDIDGWMPRQIYSMEELKGIFDLLWGTHKLVEHARRAGHHGQEIGDSLFELCFASSFPEHHPRRDDMRDFADSEAMDMVLQCRSVYRDYGLGWYSPATTRNLIRIITSYIERNQKVSQSTLCYLSMLVFKITHNAPTIDQYKKDLEAFNTVFLGNTSRASTPDTHSSVVYDVFHRQDVEDAVDFARKLSSYRESEGLINPEIIRALEASVSANHERRFEETGGPVTHSEGSGAEKLDQIDIADGLTSHF